MKAKEIIEKISDYPEAEVVFVDRTDEFFVKSVNIVQELKLPNLIEGFVPIQDKWTYGAVTIQLKG